jgi:hypothetical protein
MPCAFLVARIQLSNRLRGTGSAAFASAGAEPSLKVWLGFQPSSCNMGAIGDSRPYERSSLVKLT